MTLQGRLVRFARRIQLSVKLAWLGAGLMALVVSATVIVLTLQIRANTRLRFEDELRRNQKTFAQFQKQKLEQLTFAASLISQTASLPYALETYSADANSGVHRSDLAPTVQRELERLVRESTKDILFVTDEKGSVFASAARSGPPVPVGTDLSGMREIQQALDVRERITRGGLGVLRQPAADFQVAVYPVEVGGYTLGTLVLGERLDSGFVDAARAAFDGYVVVTVGGAIASGTFPGMNDGGARTLLASVSPADSEPVMLSIASEEFVVAPVRLGETQDGAPVRMWLVQPLTQAVRALTLPLVRGFLVYGVLAVLLAGFGAAVLARSVMRPFNRFVRYLREGTAAERVVTRFDASDAPTEVRTLNESFGELMDALHSSEAQLRQANKLEAIGTLAGGIAHDFNNLLTVITGFTEIVVSDPSLEESLKEDLGQVISASERATVLTRQLLAFSRKQVLLPTVLELGDVVEDIAPMLRRLLGEHIILRIARERSERTRVLVDRGQLEQVVINLVVNARDAMPRGGHIVIRMGGTNGTVTLSVDDTGSGIPQGVLERIFEPFFTTKEPGKGTGLGLATVYGIVKQSGGTIDVTSTVGVGTTFAIALPGSDEALTAPAHGDKLSAPRGTETILLVEDEPSVRLLAQRALEGRGYTVLAAAGHADAFAFAAGARVDLLLTDVVMPEMGGPQVADRLLLLQPDAAVVYMSGYADDALRSFDLGLGVNFLRKPFTTAELARIVRSSLDARAAIATVAMLVLFALPQLLFAQGGVLVQGIADAEFWSTDSGSSLLTRNHARPGALGRLVLWTAAEPWPGFVVYAQGEAAAGSAQNATGRAEFDLDQAGIRWSPASAFTVDIGKMPHPVGTFEARRFSTRNPLIGEPDGYPVVYPLGVQISGATTHFDYRMAAVSLPVTHPDYVPAASAVLRPAVGAGFTPFTGLRIGGSATWGPYLNSSIPAPLLMGQSWQHFHQRVEALDLAYSHDYLELHAEYARGEYDVPGFSSAVAGETWYVEAKYALGPRVFVAARAERNNYPFISPVGPATWTGSDTDFDDGEIGIGYRVSASLLAKVSYRADRWHLTPAQLAFLGPGGHALAVQLSQSFDVLAMLGGPH